MRTHHLWQRVDAVIRRVDTNLDTDTVELTDEWPELTKSIDALSASTAEWARRLNAKESMLPLFSDLATQLGAAGIAGIPGTGVNDIKKALTPTEGELAPGLNLVSRGLGKGRCWYLENGKPSYFETGQITVDGTGIGKCGLKAGAGVSTFTSVFVIIVFLQDGSELGRVTLSYPLP